jgi:adenylyl-sulfate kinase
LASPGESPHPGQVCPALAEWSGAHKNCLHPLPILPAYRPKKGSVLASSNDENSGERMRTFGQEEAGAGSHAAARGSAALCLWMTGLPGSGKSTISARLLSELRAQGRGAVGLDGDALRRGLNRDLGFSDGDRHENIRRTAEVARLMVDAGLITVVSLISPFRVDRAFARSRFERGRFCEIFVDAPLSVCEQRDPKGLYAKARRGELAKMTGIDSPYEPPVHPDLQVHTDLDNVDACVERILSWLRG